MKNSPYNQLIAKLDFRRGAPMGRYSEESQTDMSDFKQAIFDQRVPLTYDGAYDKGGAYWGCGAQLRVMYTKDLGFYQFYRVDDIPEHLKQFSKYKDRF